MFLLLPLIPQSEGLCVKPSTTMNQTEAKKIIKDTEYLDNRILTFENPEATAGGRQYCRVIDKKYLFSSTDENKKQGAVKIRFKDVMTGKEFMEQLTMVARTYTKKVVKEVDDAKAQLLVLLMDETEPVKSLEWVMARFKAEDPKFFETQKHKIETYLFEMWLESKISRSTFKSKNLTVYSIRK